jgi:Protein of unknown function (DUF3079)
MLGLRKALPADDMSCGNGTIRGPHPNRARFRPRNFGGTAVSNRV